MLVATLLAAGAAPGAEVRLPLRLDDAFLREQMATQLFPAGPEDTPTWRISGDCFDLAFSHPAIAVQPHGIVADIFYEGKVGTGALGLCVGLDSREGILNVTLAPMVEAHSDRVRFRVSQSRLSARDGSLNIEGLAWALIKPFAHRHLEDFIVDFGPAIEDIRRLLPLFVSHEDATIARGIVDSLRIAEWTSEPGTLIVTLQFDVPAVASLPTPAPQPTLSIEEAQRWAERWQTWDVFLTFVVKQLAGDTTSPTVVAELRELLLDARHDLAEALRPTAGGGDPVRRLFVESWARLAPIVRESALQLPGDAAVRYLTFLAAADALAALDALGPGFGFSISADGLRALARAIDPTLPAEALRYDDAVDPALRRMFGFPDEPPATPTPDVDGEPHDRLSWVWRSLDRLLWPAPAFAGAPSFRGWIPEGDDLQEYLRAVRKVLREASEENDVPEAYRRIYREVMLATAWQESCWRQFVRASDGTISTITSPAGAVGIMQINPRVWRGMYRLDSLQRDLVYNAGAGAEILRHYMIDHAVRKNEHERDGGLHNLGPATYSAYNGGPKALTRYRTRSYLADRKFRDKLERVRAGGELAVASCFGL